MPQKLGREKFDVHEKVLCTGNCHEKYWGIATLYQFPSLKTSLSALSGF